MNCDFFDIYTPDVHAPPDSQVKGDEKQIRRSGKTEARQISEVS